MTGKFTMPIIKKIEQNLIRQSIKMDAMLLDEIKSYCSHFDVSLDEFVNQASKFILKKDADWKKINNKSKKGKAS